jgi:hypothetical protein
VLFFLLFTFLLGSVGVAVNKHICYTEGIVEFYIVSDNIACNEHNDEHETKSSCCKKPVKESTTKPDCCNDDVVYAVLDINQFQHEIKSFSINLFAAVFFKLFHFDFDCIICNVSTYIDTDFPDLWKYKNKLSYLSFVSVFRI